MVRIIRLIGFSEFSESTEFSEYWQFLANFGEDYFDPSLILQK